MIGVKMANPVIREKTIYEFAMKDVKDLIKELKDPFNVSPEAREFVDFLWNEYVTRTKKPTIGMHPIAGVGYGVYRNAEAEKAWTKANENAFDSRYAGSGYTLKGVMDSLVESN